MRYTIDSTYTHQKTKLEEAFEKTRKIYEGIDPRKMEVYEILANIGGRTLK